MQRATEGRAVCLVGMTGEDPDDPIAVARHHRFQGSRLTHDERRVVVRRTRQATGMVEHDQVAPRCRRPHFVFQPSELRCPQGAASFSRNRRVEHDHPQPVDEPAVVVRPLVVGTLLAQNDATERRPVIVVAEREEDRGASTAKLVSTSLTTS